MFVAQPSSDSVAGRATHPCTRLRAPLAHGPAAAAAAHSAARHCTVVRWVQAICFLCAVLILRSELKVAKRGAGAVLLSSEHQSAECLAAKVSSSA